MLLGAFVVSTFAWGSGATLALMVLLVALWQLDSGSSDAAHLLVMSSLMVLPLAALIVGRVFDQLSSTRAVFSLLAIPLTVALWFESNMFFDFFDTAIRVRELDSSALRFGYWTALIGAALFIATAVALSVWMIVVVFELLLGFLCKSARVHALGELVALRPLFIIFLLSLVSNLAPTLVTQELSPMNLFVQRAD